MICKHCGTESQGKVCSYCGRPISEDDILILKKRENPSHTEEPEAQEAATQKSKKAEAAEKQAEKKSSRRYRGRVRFSRVFFPTLLLFLPIVYFFVDVFTVLPATLFELDGAGNTLVSVFVNRLSSPEYGMNTMQELQLLTFGDAAPLYSAVSFAGRADAGALYVPLMVVLGFAVASALMGVLLLLSAGRLLRSRLATDLMLLAGSGAAFSPLIGLFALRMIYFFSGGLAVADAAMGQYTLSVESILMVGLGICLMTPALAILRREAAAGRASLVHIATPFCRIGGRSFGLTRLIAMFLIGACAFLALLQMFLPILPAGHLFRLGTAWEEITADFKTFASSLWAVLSAQAAQANFATLTNTLTKLVFVLLGPLVLLSGVFVFFSFWNVLCCKRKNLAERKRVHRSIGKVGERLRSMYLIPFRFYTAAQIFLVAVLLLGTKIVFHVDAGNVTGTLSLVYMLIGYVKTLCGTNTLYAILGACGALLWHAAYNMSAKLIDLSCRATGKR